MSLNLRKKEKTDGEKKRNFKDSFHNSFNKKHLKNGSYSAGMIVVFIAIVVVINMIVGALPTKYTQFDISASKLYSIGDETKEMLQGLQKDVTIYQIAQSGHEDDTISKLLQRYEDESDHVKVEVKDPVVNPKFVTTYTSDNIPANSLIVVCGDRNKVVNYNSMYESTMDYNTYQYQTTGFDGEGQLTSAIAYVVSDDLPILYTLEGHGEAELDATFKEDIEKANMEIKSLNLITEEKVPEDADCLMIHSLTSDLTDAEKDAIVEYLENGGKVVVFSDYTTEKMDNFDEVLTNYGVMREEGIVFEGDSQHYAMQTPYYLVPTINSTDATTNTASGNNYVLAPYAQGISRLDGVRDSVTVESLLSTSTQAYSKTNVNGNSIKKEADDVDGPFDLGVSITENLDDGKETKILYFSTSALMDSQVNQMVAGGNEKLLMETMNWLTGSAETATVSIPSKSLEVSYLTMTDYDASFWKICTIGLIPGVFIVFGFVIWLRRRKA